MTLQLKMLKKFDKNIQKNIKLSNFSWFNLGGPAEYFFKPENKKQLVEFFKENQKTKLKITILGAGSNTLIRDKGVKGIVVKLGSSFSKINLIDKTTIEVGAATLDRKVANFAMANNIGGFEFLACIPGSIGGAIIMNSGCFDSDISKVVHSISVINVKTSLEKEITKDEIDFFYRGSSLPETFIITSVKLKGYHASSTQIKKKQVEMIEKKKLSQPSQIKTCGSTFKNINKQKKAWKLIKETGCENFQEGDASISKKHCNFFVNNGKAKSSDIEKLINRVRQKVEDKTGVNLELEIKIIGE
tara:strand:+ start:16 stop:921 length:906 start_codon:yes stop_codon:yes gene_type:complete